MTTANPGGERDRGYPGLPHLNAANRDYVERNPDERRGDIPADSLSNRLLLARTHAGYLTVKEAAERCGLNYGSWSNWERGARPRDLLEVVRRVADGLDIDYNWLLFGGPLLGARGRPVAKRTGEATNTYRLATVGPSVSAGRTINSGPKGRSDHSGPAVHIGQSRRAARVSPARLAEAAYGG